MPELPFAFQWTIPEDELLPLKDSVNGHLYSTYISKIQGFEYCMAIYPNGNKEQFRGQTWIFLIIKNGNVEKVEADRTFIIESANYIKSGIEIYEDTTGWGYQISETNEFFDAEKKFIVDGKFTIKINGIFKFERIDDEVAQNNEEQKWDGGEVGNELWKKDGTKDFTIITGDCGKEIKVHKLILDARSDVFSAMLNSNMKESIENQVEIPDFPFNVIEAGIKLIYHCTFTSTLSLGELIKLLQFFDKYDIPALTDKVEPYLINQISAATVVELTNCSVKTNSFKLKEKCMEFLMVTFAAKTPLADIDDLDKDILLEVVKSNFYQIVQTEKY